MLFRSFFPLQDIVTGSLVITPEPDCSLRGCETLPDPLCLNNGVCVEVADGERNGFNCSCQAGFFGTGCQFVDQCSNTPCLNGGECFINLLTPNQYTCMCADDFDGDNCEIRISPCDASPCTNGGTCQASADSSFQCLCPGGFTGDVCETDIDDCEGAPCNAGTCVDGIEGFSCMCPSGLTGSTCDIPVESCLPDSCNGRGECVQQGSSITCICNPGFTGDTCSQDIDECTAQPCQNEAICVNLFGSFVCECPPGFTGDSCDTDINECLVQQCQNGATCVNLPGGFDCMCLPGFTGALCDITMNFCSNDSCGANGRCISLVNGFECSCNPGFTGAACEIDIDDCTPTPCQNGAMCVNGPNFFTCVCDSGFTGTLCEIDVDECLSSSCENGGTCTNRIGEFSCECPPAFTGPTCGNLTDFCVGQTCYNGGTCRSTEDGFRCSCPGGWSGDQCQFPDNVVAKLDSCGFTMARDMLFDAGLVDSNGPLSLIRGSPPVQFEYNLPGARGFYFSGWIWQTAGTNAILFSFIDESIGSLGQFSSDLVNQELKFQYGSSQMISATFEGVPLQPNAWMHIALAVFNDNSVLINVDGRYSRRQTLESEGSGERPTDATAGFVVPTIAALSIGRGVPIESTSTVFFSGLVRGIAINRIVEDREFFNLDLLQNCTLGCIGGESQCSGNGRCYDLFGLDRVCRCPHGLTGQRCQQLQDRFTFDGSGFARLSTQDSLDSISFDFKTSQSSGEIYSHTNASSQLQILLGNDRTVEVNKTYCDGTASSQEVSGSQILSDLQYHSFSLSGSVQLDGGTPEEIPATASPSCDVPFMSSVLLGRFEAEDQQSNGFQGCLRDMTLNGDQLDSTLVQLTTGTQFGCTRDTAQFYGLSFLELPRFISRESQIISLGFSTQAPSGILYFSTRDVGDATGVTPNDFVAIHIQQGRAAFTFNLGEQNQNVDLRSSQLVNDGEWHRLTAVQNGTLASLYLDGNLVRAQSMGPLELLDTTSNVFVGAIPAGTPTAGFSPVAGFDGCIRDLEQNGVAADLQDSLNQVHVRFGVCN